MNSEVRLSNVYKVALLDAEGISGILVNDRGYLQWKFDESPELQDILHGFDTFRQINLRSYVDHLRKAQDQLRNAKLEAKREKDEWSRTQQER